MQPSETTVPAPRWIHAAFLSYRRIDAAPFARWLREELETFAFPPALARHRRTISIYLDTSFGRGTEDFWANNIAPALGNSQHLLVVASPSTLVPLPDGRPNWVAREIHHFCDLPHGHHVMVAMLRGTIGGPLPGGLHDKFPNLHITDMRSFRRWLPSLLQPDVVQQALLELVATTYGVESHEMPLLHAEQERRRRGFVARVAVAALAIAALLLTALVIAVKERAAAIAAQQDAVKAERAAREQANLAHSEELVAYSGSLRDSGQTWEQSALLAAVSLQLRPTADADSALRTDLRMMPLHLKRLSLGVTPNELSFAPSGRRIVVGSDHGAKISAPRGRVAHSARGRVGRRQTSRTGSQRLTHRVERRRGHLRLHAALGDAGDSGTLGRRWRHRGCAREAQTRLVLGDGNIRKHEPGHGDQAGHG